MTWVLADTTVICSSTHQKPDGSTENYVFQKNNCHFVFDTKVVRDGVLLISTFPSLVIVSSAFNPFKGDPWNSLDQVV